MDTSQRVQTHRRAALRQQHAFPEIPGFSTRGWKSSADWSSIARLVTADLNSVGVKHHITADAVKGWLADSDSIDRDDDFLFVDVDGETVAYVLSPTYVENDGRRIYRHMCRVDPAWHGKGLGKALLGWVVAYNTERAATLGPGTLQTTVDDNDPALVGLLDALGYRPAQHEADLVRRDLEHIPDKRLPDGVEIRPVDESHLRVIYEADRDAFADHWGSRPHTDSDWTEFLGFAHRDESLWKVAWAGERVVGQVRGFVNVEENERFDRKRGWAEFISTAADWRGRGVASALICETLRGFEQRGLEEAALGVHVENQTGAYRLYQNLGFEVINSSTSYERRLA